jgi:PilZ domain-containing protein
MGLTPMTERRHEPRTKLDLALLVWGIDTKGERFLEEARARDISVSGAMLTGLDLDLRSGDLIGILYAGKRARYRVVWIRYDEAGEKMQVAVHRVQADPCPWLNLLTEDPAPIAATINTQAP